MSRQFHLGDILSITTDVLLSPRLIEGVYDILNYMTGDTLFTHQLPRAGRECKPWLLRQHPQLNGVEYPEDPKPADPFEWLEAQCAIYGDMLPVDPIPADDHTRKDAVDELAEMIGPEKIIVVKTESEP